MSAEAGLEAAASPPLGPQRRMVRRETLIGVLGNAAIAAIIVSLLFASRGEVPVLGRDGALFGIVPGTFMFTLGMTIGLTLTLRARVRKGLVPRIPRGSSPAPGAALPRNVVLRAVLLGAIAELCLVPPTFALLWLLAPPTWSFPVVLAANVAYFATLASFAIPVIAWRALADGG